MERSATPPGAIGLVLPTFVQDTVPPWAAHPGQIGDPDRGDAYDPAHAEDAAGFALMCAADEQGNPAPTDLLFEHYVPVGVAAAS